MKRTFVSVASIGALAILGPQAPAQGPERGTRTQFQTVVIDPSMSGDCKMAGDIDGDGFIDAVIGGFPGQNLAWYRWPDWRRTQISVPLNEFTTDGALADIDGDGDLDVIVPDGDGGQNLLWMRNPLPDGDPLVSSQWARLPIGALVGFGKDVKPGDFNGDGLMDIASRTSSQAYIFFQQTGGTWQRVSVASGLEGEGMATGDLDGDGDLDLVLRGRWLENPSPGADARTTPWPSFSITGSAPVEFKALVADIDVVPGPEVLYTSSEGTGPVRWYTPSTGNPRGSWVGHTIIESINRCHTLQAGDIDGDGRVDVVLAQMHTTNEREVIIALNNGAAASWTFEVIANTGLHNGVLADFGSDGDLDLFGSNWAGNPPLMLFDNLSNPCTTDINGDGVVNSSDITAFLFNWLDALSKGGLLADFNNDGVVSSSDISAFLSQWLAVLVKGC